MSKTAIVEYLALIEAERDSRPAEAMLLDEINRLKAQVNDSDLSCGFCGHHPEEHGDSDHGPMSACPVENGSYSMGSISSEASN